MNKEQALASVRLCAAYRAESLRAAAIAKTITPTEIIANEEYVPDWKPRNYPTVGEPVQHDGQVYKVLQAHNSTGNDGWFPNGNTALFEVYHTTDPTKAKPWVPPNGTSGMYKKGEVCLLDGTVKCAKNDTIYSPGDYAADWENA